MQPLLPKLLAILLSGTAKHDLSWQELGQGLLHLKNNLEHEPTEREAQIELLGTRVPSLPLSRTRIGDSPNRGKGLFAAQDCKEGDLLTCYPGDVVMTGQGFRPKNPIEEGLLESNDMLRDYLQRYCIGALDDDEGKPEVAIMGLPQLDQDMAYAGHFINDGVSKPPTTEAELEAYVQESQRRVNAEFIPLENLHMVTLATRDIARDEEIFVYYGPIYWTEHTATWRGGS